MDNLKLNKLAEEKLSANQINDNNKKNITGGEPRCWKCVCPEFLPCPPMTDSNGIQLFDNSGFGFDDLKPTHDPCQGSTSNPLL